MISHLNRLDETVQMRGHNIGFNEKEGKLSSNTRFYVELYFSIWIDLRELVTLFSPENSRLLDIVLCITFPVLSLYQHKLLLSFLVQFLS